MPKSPPIKGFYFENPSGAFAVPYISMHDSAAPRLAVCSRHVQHQIVSSPDSTMTKPQSPSDASTAPQKSRGGFARIANATRYSWLGLQAAVRHEAAFRQELIIILPALVICWFLPIPVAEKLLLFAVSTAVLIVELLNSAIEAIVDRVSTELHPLAGRAKDLGSAAVMLSLAVAATAWLLLAGPVLWGWLNR
jgi:diacylglycerol kinase (ATP)